MIYLVDDDLAVREAMTLLLATYGKRSRPSLMRPTCSPMWKRRNRVSCSWTSGCLPSADCSF
jgi:hypothetical protein